MTEPPVLALVRLSSGAAVIAAALKLSVGLLIVWVMTRQRFPRRSVADSFISLPIALTALLARYCSFGVR